MTQTKLQILRENKNWSIKELAEEAAWCQEKKRPSMGVILHFENAIRIIEGENIAAPQPRKSYEYKNIAQALKCSVDELVEEQIDEKYIVKMPYMPSLGLHSYYTVNTKEEAEHIAKQCIKAEITREGE